jgi:hypothetical protein
MCRGRLSTIAAGTRGGHYYGGHLVRPQVNGRLTAVYVVVHGPTPSWPPLKGRSSLRQTRPCAQRLALRSALLLTSALPLLALLSLLLAFAHFFSFLQGFSLPHRCCAPERFRPEHEGRTRSRPDGRVSCPPWPPRPRSGVRRSPARCPRGLPPTRSPWTRRAPVSYSP